MSDNNEIKIDELIEFTKKLSTENYNIGFLCHANPDDEFLDGYVDKGRKYEKISELLTELKSIKDNCDNIRCNNEDKLKMTNNEAKEYLKELQESDYIKESLLIDEYRHALAMAIKALDNWIYCSNDLPKITGRYYIVTVKSTVSGLKYTRPALYDKDGFSTRIDEEVIAWQPLPKSCTE